MQPFDKSESLFPVKRRYRYLSHCAIGPMYAPAADAAKRFIDSHCQAGRSLFAEYGNALTSFRENTARWLRTSADNIAYVSNTSEGMNLIEIRDGSRIRIEPIRFAGNNSVSEGE